jgi:phage gp36-like protein
MAYCSAQDLHDRMTAARLDAMLPEATQAALLTAIITRASDRIDGYLSARFTVPVPASGYMQDIALALCEYEVYRRSSAPAIPEKIRQAYEDAIKDLKELADGKRGIGGATPATADANPTGITITSDDTVLTTAGMANW